MTPMIALTIHQDLADLIRIETVEADGVRIEPSSALLLAAIGEHSAALVREHAGHAPGEIEGLAPARQLYRAFGVDPTRTRPSSEALVRRILQGKPFPRIVNAVDLCNLCSVAFLLPLGLYDAERINGQVTLRRGEPGDGYEGIRKDRVNLEGRPALYDATGPFGNPSSDSSRTCVTNRTSALLMVIFAPASYPPPRLQSHVAWAREAIARHLPGSSSET